MLFSANPHGPCYIYFQQTLIGPGRRQDQRWISNQFERDIQKNAERTCKASTRYVKRYARNSQRRYKGSTKDHPGSIVLTAFVSSEDPIFIILLGLLHPLCIPAVSFVHPSKSSLHLSFPMYVLPAKPTTTKRKHHNHCVLN